MNEPRQRSRPRESLGLLFVRHQDAEAARKGASIPEMREMCAPGAVGERMNNSQFWTWTDHWQGWDWMREEDEAELELAEWADETLWMICLMCGSPVEGCMCENIEDATPIPPCSEGQQHPSQ